MLILDSLWQEQFKNKKTERITKLETKIKELLKENARLTEAEQALIQKKKECLRQILKLSESVHEQNDLEAKEATNVFQRAVIDINSELTAVEKKADSLPKELEDANRELLLETISIIYFDLRQKQERIKELAPKIDNLRKDLQHASAERAASEEEAARTYQLLHNLVGREIINRLDSLYGTPRV
jgi:hypothetical protein